MNPRKLQRLCSHTPLGDIVIPGWWCPIEEELPPEDVPIIGAWMTGVVMSCWRHGSLWSSGAAPKYWTRPEYEFAAFTNAEESKADRSAN